MVRKDKGKDGRKRKLKRVGGNRGKEKNKKGEKLWKWETSAEEKSEQTGETEGRKRRMMNGEEEGRQEEGKGRKGGDKKKKGEGEGQVQRSMAGVKFLSVCLSVRPIHRHPSLRNLKTRLRTLNKPFN